jgi:hypothetical protein
VANGTAVINGVTKDLTNKVVVAGDTYIDGSSSMSYEANDFWTNGILLENAAALRVQKDYPVFYVKDDTTLSKKGSVFDFEGTYRGYGDGKSAIILNGTEASVDLTGATEIMLAGNSYINSKQFTTDAATAKDVLLGNSVSAKVDQIIYLAPQEALGMLNGQPVTNPMSDDVYREWKTQIGELAVGTEVEKVKHPLRYYHIGANEFNCIFRTVNGRSFVYVYIDFTNAGVEDAARYYADYRAAERDSLTSYFNKYKNTITVPSESSATKLYTAGNMLSFVYGGGSSINVIGETLSDLSATEQETMSINMRKWSDRYDALSAKLVDDKTLLTTEELGNSVYKNLILKEKMDLLHGASEVFEYNSHKALVIDGNYTSNQASDQYSIIIASGNVKVDNSFSGLIIAGGKINIANSSAIQIAADSKVVEELLLKGVKSGSDKNLVSSYFVNGDTYTGIQEEEEDPLSVPDEYLKLDRIITYVNWTKR